MDDTYERRYDDNKYRLYMPSWIANKNFMLLQTQKNKKDKITYLIKILNKIYLRHN